MAPPPPHLGGCLAAPPPLWRVVQGEWPAGRGCGGPWGGPYPPPGAHKKRGRRGTDGAAVYYRPLPFPPSLLELTAPPRPSVLIAPPSPSPSPSPPPSLGRGGYGFLAVDSRGADRGDGFPKCGARRAGVEGDAGVGYGQVGQPCGGVPAGGRGAGQYGRPQGQGLDGGHPAGWRGGGVCACYAGWRHQVKWRGLGGGAGEGSLSVAPGQRRAPEPGVLGGGESSDLTAASPPPVQVDGGVGVGLPRVESGDEVGGRGRDRAPHGGGSRAAAAQTAGHSPGGGGGGRGGAGRSGG